MALLAIKADETQLRPCPSLSFNGAVTRRKSGICIILLDGTGGLQLTDGKHGDEEPKWSPDGDRIIFDSDRTGFREIYTIYQRAVKMIRRNARLFRALNRVQTIPN